MYNLKVMRGLVSDYLYLCKIFIELEIPAYFTG